MKRIYLVKLAATSLVIPAVLFGAAGCRYVLGLTDREEGTLTQPDAGNPAQEASTPNDTGASDATVVRPKCRGPQCVPTTCDYGDAAADSGADAARVYGAANNCGPDGGDNCCAFIEIEGGAFYPNNQTDAGDGGPSAVSHFMLDKYEVTLGRFQRFLDDDYGTQEHPPLQGEGQLPTSYKGYLQTGWDSKWNTGQLPANKVAFDLALSQCGAGAYVGTYSEQKNSATWPVTCLNWYQAFAFCIYDGGRLPTELEWSYAATGGSGVGGQRRYPWGPDDPDGGSYADYCHSPTAQTSKIDGVGCGDTNSPFPVGSYPKGEGAFGNFDMGGNGFEYVWDYFTEATKFPCTDCAVNTIPDVDALSDAGVYFRTIHGGSWKYPAAFMENATRFGVAPESRSFDKLETIGFRCARDYQ